MGKPITFLVKVEARPGAPLDERDRFQVMEDLVLLGRLGEAATPELRAEIKARHDRMPKAPLR